MEGTTENEKFLFINIYMPFFNSSKQEECLLETIDAITMIETIINARVDASGANASGDDAFGADASRDASDVYTSESDASGAYISGDYASGAHGYGLDTSNCMRPLPLQ